MFRRLRVGIETFIVSDLDADQNVGIRVVRVTRFVGVMANITDCRSVAMGSIPVRTA